MYEVDILIRPFPPTGDAQDYAGELANPFQFAVIFDPETHRCSRIGFSEIKIKFSAATKEGRLVLIRADRNDNDVISEKDAPEGDGIKLLFRRYSFKKWKVTKEGVWFSGCSRH